MEYLEFLKGLHEAVRPRAYLEIGLRHGDSLALADCPSLGVDPAFNLRVELGDNVELLRETSDEYFARAAAAEAARRPRPDMAFIDGMHLAEFALRDFIGRGAAVAVDGRDRLRRHPAAHRRGGQPRPPHARLDRRRLQGARHPRPPPPGPDLPARRHPADRAAARARRSTRPTGCSRMRQDMLLEQMVVPDPQDVPADVIERRGVLEPEARARVARVAGAARPARPGHERAARGSATCAARPAATSGASAPARCDGSCPLERRDRRPRQPAVGPRPRRPARAAASSPTTIRPGAYVVTISGSPLRSTGAVAPEPGHRERDVHLPAARAAAARRPPRRSARSARRCAGAADHAPASSSRLHLHLGARGQQVLASRRRTLRRTTSARGAAQLARHLAVLLRAPPRRASSVGGTQNVRLPSRSKRSAGPARRTTTPAAARGACRRARSRGCAPRA